MRRSAFLPALAAMGLILSMAPLSMAQENGDKPAAEEGKSSDAPVSFTRQIAPLLVEKCVACHGARQPKSAYQLHTFESLFAEGDFGTPPIAPGKPDESQLFLLLAEEDKDSWMPKEGDKLPAEQIALFRRWIEEGARFDGADEARTATLASIVPATYDPAPEAYRAAMPITAVAFDGSGEEVAVGGYNEITIWSASDAALLRRVPQVAQRTYGLAYSPDGKTLAAASGTPGQLGEVKLFDPASGEPLKTLGRMEDVAFAVAWSPDGELLAACSADRTAKVWDVASGELRERIEDHADWAMDVAFSPDGKLLASASRDKTSKVFDLEKGQSQTTYNGHGEPVFGVAFSPDGKQVLSAGGDRKVHLWNPSDGKKAAEIGGFGGEVHALLVADGSVFSAAADKTLRQHDLAKRNQTRAYAGHTDWVYCLAYHSRLKRLASGSFDGKVLIHSTEDGAPLAEFLAAPGLASGSQASK